MFLVIDFNDTPGVTATTDLATVGGSDFGIGTDNREWNLVHDFLVFADCFLVVEFVSWACEDLDVVVVDVVEDLEEKDIAAYKSLFAKKRKKSDSKIGREKERTLSLKSMTSSSVKVSDLAMTGIKLTLVCRRRMTWMSSSFNE